jgi:hypothetical protein
MIGTPYFLFCQFFGLGAELSNRTQNLENVGKTTHASIPDLVELTHNLLWAGQPKKKLIPSQ